MYSAGLTGETSEDAAGQAVPAANKNKSSRHAEKARPESRVRRKQLVIIPVGNLVFSQMPAIMTNANSSYANS
jgi:hypothetical protein